MVPSSTPRSPARPVCGFCGTSSTSAPTESGTRRAATDSPVQPRSPEFVRSVGVDPFAGLAGGAVGAFLSTLVVGAILVAVAIPLGIVLYVLWALGSTIAFLAIADRLVGREDGWTKPLLVAAAINGGLALTGVGGILAFVIGAAGGDGAVLEGRI